VPAYVGIHVAGTPSGLCSIVGVQRMNMTAKITLRPSDNGLRMEILDDLPYQHATGNLLAGTVPIRITRIVQNIDGMAPSPSTKPFLTAPTRCSNWDITTYTAGYQANTIPYTSDLFPVDGVLDSAAATESATPNCTTIPALNTGFTMAMTNNQAGRPVGVRATVTNTVPTDSTSQGAYAKIFKMTLPVGYKINPAIANRLGANGCISDDFFRPIPGQAVSETAPSCLPGTQVGTVAVKAPEVTGDLVGKVYLGDPLPGDEAGGIYRLYVYAARAGVVTKFQGTAVANPVNGQVVVTMDNNGLGLP
jgi:hypothetical protein